MKFDVKNENSKNHHSVIIYYCVQLMLKMKINGLNVYVFKTKWQFIYEVIAKNIVSNKTIQWKFEIE